MQKISKKNCSNFKKTENELIKENNEYLNEFENDNSLDEGRFLFGGVVTTTVAPTIPVTMTPTPTTRTTTRTTTTTKKTTIPVTITTKGAMQTVVPSKNPVTNIPTANTTVITGNMSANTNATDNITTPPYNDFNGYYDGFPQNVSHIEFTSTSEKPGRFHNFNKINYPLFQQTPYLYNYEPPSSVVDQTLYDDDNFKPTFPIQPNYPDQQADFSESNNNYNLKETDFKPIVYYKF